MTAIHDAMPAQQTLADRLHDVRSTAFVGRDGEIALFRSALHRSGPAAGFAVLCLWGLGGIGKSALLRRFADEVAASGRRGSAWTRVSSTPHRPHWSGPRPRL